MLHSRKTASVSFQQIIERVFRHGPLKRCFHRTSLGLTCLLVALGLIGSTGCGESLSAETSPSNDESENIEDESSLNESDEQDDGAAETPQDHPDSGDAPGDEPDQPTGQDDAPPVDPDPSETEPGDTSGNDSSDEPSEDDGDDSDDASLPTDDITDIFAPSDIDGHDIIQFSDSLEEILEFGGLTGACERYEADPTNQAKKLMCGKYMFFYETFGTTGVPADIVEFTLTRFQNEVGPGFANYGMHLDPYSEVGLPIGMNTGREGQYSFTCASCHFSQLPDGNYAVGAANHQYDYGKHTLALILPMMWMGSWFIEIDERAIAAIEPVMTTLENDWVIRSELMNLLVLMALEAPPLSFPPEIQAEYASWQSGTMDFVTAPLDVNDDVHTVSKISSLFEIPHAQEEQDADMVHAMLGWTGNVRSIDNFIQLFVDFGGGDPAQWPPERTEPLADYILSLKAPAAPEQPIDLIAQGEEIFFSNSCIDCHQGPRGSGIDLFSYEEIGTDAAMALWMDPEHDGEPCCDVSLAHDPITNALKSPRLVGLWAMDRFLHNGSVNSLEELFCMDGQRPESLPAPFANTGHLYGCDDLSEDEKEALITFLESH